MGGRTLIVAACALASGLACGCADARREHAAPDGPCEPKVVVAEPVVAPPPREAARPATVVSRTVKPADVVPAARGFVLSYGLTRKDADALAAVLGDAPAVLTRATGREFAAAGRTLRGSVVATTATRPEPGLELAAGRFLTEDDAKETPNVVVLTQPAAAELFPDADPVGRTVTIGGFDFTVVGVVRDRGPEAGSALGRAARAARRDAYMALPTYRARFGEVAFTRTADGRVGEKVELDRITVTVSDRAKAEELAGRIREVLRARHGREDDWQVEVR